MYVEGAGVGRDGREGRARQGKGGGGGGGARREMGGGRG